MAPQGPIGVFDSGIGGLSVLRALLAELPHERFVYLADNAHAPYGERSHDFVLARSRAVRRQLVDEHGIQALVIACNTATAAAVHMLRAESPRLPIVGIEPALKPAVARTRTGHIGVLATRGTLESGKFQALRQSLGDTVRVTQIACDGLADAIEKEAAGAHWAGATALIEQYVGALGPLGGAPGQIDTLVLGCTHYPLAAAQFDASLAGRAVTLIDPAHAVARRTAAVLAARPAPDPSPHALPGGARVRLLASGGPSALHAAARRWL
ncbi:glutamate racemase [Ottowia testudinis]|uniref:Glutamate racemase n=1 Tax=Ottowia testudinis TaxID=2816950 RepID=A0A975CG40_9BURK|nr:glutamate racemase [Ottowia testudinis]QTD44242.1 glutamate racemase [Ottowia testudinis]